MLEKEGRRDAVSVGVVVSEFTAVSLCREKH